MRYIQRFVPTPWQLSRHCSTRNINPLLIQILGINYRLDGRDVSVKFLWIQSHIGVPRNGRVGTLAKMAAEESIPQK